MSKGLSWTNLFSPHSQVLMILTPQESSRELELTGILPDGMGCVFQPRLLLLERPFLVHSLETSLWKAVHCLSNSQELPSILKEDAEPLSFELRFGRGWASGDIIK